MTTLSAVLLGGIVTIFGNASTEKLIKTSWLLYFAGAVLVLNIIIGLVSRNILLIFLQNLVGNVETGFGRLADAVKSLRLVASEPDTNPDKANRQAVAVNDLIQAEGPLQLPNLNKVGENSQIWSTSLLITAISSIILSLIVRITL
jgi:hypothetical protein